jgi:hypothetical protein
MHIGIHVKFPLLLSFGTVQQPLEELSVKYHENLFSGPRVVNRRSFMLYNIATCIARQRRDKHLVLRSRNNRTNVYSSLLGNSHNANGLAK